MLTHTGCDIYQSKKTTTTTTTTIVSIYSSSYFFLFLKSTYDLHPSFQMDEKGKSRQYYIRDGVDTDARMPAHEHTRAFSLNGLHLNSKQT